MVEEKYIGIDDFCLQMSLAFALSFEINNQSSMRVIPMKEGNDARLIKITQIVQGME